MWSLVEDTRIYLPSSNYAGIIPEIRRKIRYKYTSTTCTTVICNCNTVFFQPPARTCALASPYFLFTAEFSRPIIPSPPLAIPPLASRHQTSPPLSVSFRSLTHSLSDYELLSLHTTFFLEAFFRASHQILPLVAAFASTALRCAFLHPLPVNNYPRASRNPRHLRSFVSLCQVFNTSTTAPFPRPSSINPQAHIHREKVISLVATICFGWRKI